MTKSRTINSNIYEIEIFPLYGTSVSFKTIEEAAAFVEKFEPESYEPLALIRVTVRYDDGTVMRNEFPSKKHVSDFLENRKKGII
ncbi:hypothetical protein MJD09_22370 [bacterium]|nr:hypothetical protein [bacterium]